MPRVLKVPDLSNTKCSQIALESSTNVLQWPIVLFLFSAQICDVCNFSQGWTPARGTQGDQHLFLGEGDKHRWEGGWGGAEGTLTWHFFDFQIGIVSLGKGCGDPRFPGLYTRVSSMMPWLIEATFGYTVWDSNCQKIKKYLATHKNLQKEADIVTRIVPRDGRKL